MYDLPGVFYLHVWSAMIGLTRNSSEDFGGHSVDGNLNHKSHFENAIHHGHIAKEIDGFCNRSLCTRVQGMQGLYRYKPLLSTSPCICQNHHTDDQQSYTYRSTYLTITSPLLSVQMASGSVSRVWMDGVFNIPAKPQFYGQPCRYVWVLLE